MTFDDSVINDGRPKPSDQACGVEAAAQAYARAVRAQCLADLDDWTRRLSAAAETINGKARSGRRAQSRASPSLDP